MCRPIRALTQSRGFNPKNHILSIFGGAGGQHACAIARELGISRILIHKYCGILSAYGLGLADVVQEREEPSSEVLSPEAVQLAHEDRFPKLVAENERALGELGFATQDDIQHSCFLNLRYEGTDTSIMVERPADGDYAEMFRLSHQREFGFWLTKRRVLVDNIRVRSVGKSKTINAIQIPKAQGGELPSPMTSKEVYFVTDGNQTRKLSTPVFDLEALKGGMTLAGPAIILNQTSTILVEPGCQAEIDSYGSVIIEAKDGHGRQDEYLSFKTPEEVPFGPIELSIFGHRFMSIAEQMGITLQRTAVSTNIKERLDFSCALFDPEGNLVANAPHLPVHLGSMQEAVRY
jgi:5-oxoprolinase (ATP-hydrolysing)